MLSAESYRQRAAECAAEAAAATLPRVREKYLHAAEHWLRLAETSDDTERRKQLAALEAEIDG